MIGFLGLALLFLIASKEVPETHIEFSNMREILKNDMLEEEMKKKEKG